jgi:para-aminobenzoate synthetase/4-amino-4-deoxychorismate lyase
VAIRTLQLEQRNEISHSVRFGIGGGIVADSDSEAELQETYTKARFLTQMDPGFTLFETMLFRHGRLRHRAGHLQRLKNSAKALGFIFDEQRLTIQLSMHVASLDQNLAYRVRLDLWHGGHANIESAQLGPLNPSSNSQQMHHQRVKLVLAPRPVVAHERALLAHKTSLRTCYDAAIRDAIKLGAFDAVFVNLQGAVTEGGRSNLLVKLDGKWCTPAVSSGALPGVMRDRILRLAPSIEEREIPIEALGKAQGLAVCNALRGVLHAEWL